MVRSAHLILFAAVTMALFLSSYAWYQDKNNPDRPCKGGPMDMPVRCGTTCPLTCEQPNPRPCNRRCKINACECRRGYYRRRDGKCTTRRGCRELPPKKN